MTEKYEDVLEDVDRVFNFMADTTYQERAHEYLRRRKVDRSYEDTAVQRVVTDLVERAAACSGTRACAIASWRRPPACSTWRATWARGGRRRMSGTTTSRRGSDPVASPAHYTSGGIECIDAMEAALTPEEFRGYLRGNCIKYLWRCELKGRTMEDLEKCEWYLKRLIAEVGELETP